MRLPGPEAESGGRMAMPLTFALLLRTFPVGERNGRLPNAQQTRLIDLSGCTGNSSDSPVEAA